MKLIAYKGFNKNLECTLGKGIFKYEIGKTYTEDKAECASTGFHCVEEPIEVLRWYSSQTSRYCIVSAEGDIHEDGTDKISCSQMTILKELSLRQIAILECKWIQEHPDRHFSNLVRKDEGFADAGNIVIVRGKHPKAAGAKGSTIFILKEAKGSRDIEEAGVFLIDGITYKENTYYSVNGRKARCAKKN